MPKINLSKKQKKHAMRLSGLSVVLHEQFVCFWYKLDTSTGVYNIQMLCQLALKEGSFVISSQPVAKSPRHSGKNDPFLTYKKFAKINSREF